MARNDPFGFEKAINYAALADPRVLAVVADIFEKPACECRFFSMGVEVESGAWESHDYSTSEGCPVHDPNYEPDLSGVDSPSREDEWSNDYSINPIELGAYDDDPSPYDGTYSEE